MRVTLSGCLHVDFTSSTNHWILCQLPLVFHRISRVVCPKYYSLEISDDSGVFFSGKAKSKTMSEAVDSEKKTSAFYSLLQGDCRGTITAWWGHHANHVARSIALNNSAKASNVGANVNWPPWPD